VINGAILKLPAKSALAQVLYSEALARKDSQKGWSDLGPSLITEVLTRAEDLADRFGEVTVYDSPVGNRAADAVDELANGGLALGGVLLAVEILRHDDLGRQKGQGLGHLDVLLFEDDLAGVVGDLGSSPLPLQLVERIGLRIAEGPFDGERFPGRGRFVPGGASCGRR
jgi:hypothetical protein